MCDNDKFGEALRLRLAAVEDIAADAGAMADLFHYSCERGPHSKVLHRTLLAECVRRTLIHAAATTPFYRNSVEYADVISRDNFHSKLYIGDLPVVTRKDLSEAPKDFLAETIETAWISHTSGSSGRPVSIHRSFQEVHFQQAYFQRLIDRTARAVSTRPLILTFPNVYHGVPTPLPSFGKVFVAGVTDDILISDAMRVLLDSYDFKGFNNRISILSGLGFHLAFFTSYLIERGIVPSECGVESLNITGAFSSSRLRKFLTDSWQATVFDRFTLAEIVGGATRFGPDEPFWLDPYTFAEVVDGNDFQTIESGVGLLVMTSLYPFSQRQPIIRYATGDLVRIREHDGERLVAFDFLGKVQNCLAIADDGHTIWVLQSAVLNQILADYPDFRLYEWFSSVHTAFDRSVGSQPLFQCHLCAETDDTFLLSIEVELRYAPHCFPDRTQFLNESIITDFRAASPELDRMMNKKRLRTQLKFVSPGALGDTARFKI